MINIGMKPKLAMLASLALGAITVLSAQDLTITNARIIGPNATVIERGSIVVRAGKIVSVTPGAPSTASGRVIDAKGMTAMPGFIDAHRHINTGPNEKAQMQALLEAGYTTVLSGGGPADGNITLRDHIDKGLINGPRIIPSGSLRLNNNTPETARAEVRKMADMGIKFTGEIALTPVPGPSEKELEVLRAVVDEAKKVGVMVQVHAVSTSAMLASGPTSLESGTTPWYGWRPGCLPDGSSVIANRPPPLRLTRSARLASGAISPMTLAVARMVKSELHCTTSILTGPSPWICMTSAPSNFRLADNRAAAAIISPSNLRIGSGYSRRASTSRQVFCNDTISPRTGAALNINLCS